MLYPIYNAVKARLTEYDSEQELKAIEWFNLQYEGSIPTTPRCFVEFPEGLKFDRISKDTRRTVLKIRVHIASQAITATDGTVSDQVSQEHENVATMVLNALDGYVLKNGEVQLTTALQPAEWKHWHKYRSWMVTTVEFEAKLLF